MSSKLENSREYLEREIFEFTRIINASKWALVLGSASEADTPLLRQEIEKRSAMRACYKQQLDRIAAADDGEASC